MFHRLSLSAVDSSPLIYLRTSPRLQGQLGFNDFLGLFRSELLEAQEVVAYIAMRASDSAIPPREPSLIEVCQFPFFACLVPGLKEYTFLPFRFSVVFKAMLVQTRLCTSVVVQDETSWRLHDLSTAYDMLRRIQHNVTTIHGEPEMYLPMAD